MSTDNRNVRMEKVQLVKVRVILSYFTPYMIKWNRSSSCTFCRCDGIAMKSDIAERLYDTEKREIKLSYRMEKNFTIYKQIHTCIHRIALEKSGENMAWKNYSESKDMKNVR